MGNPSKYINAISLHLYIYSDLDNLQIYNNII
jgi:hypothetical protein